MTAIEVDPTDGSGIYQRQVERSADDAGRHPVHADAHLQQRRGNSGTVRAGMAAQLVRRGDAGERADDRPGSRGRLSRHSPTTRGCILTRPDGVRTGFSFTPTAVVLGDVTVYQPAWTADDTTGGWTLSMIDPDTLIKVGNEYYDSATGLPYNPMNSSSARLPAERTGRRQLSDHDPASGSPRSRRRRAISSSAATA